MSGSAVAWAFTFAGLAAAAGTWSSALALDARRAEVAARAARVEDGLDAAEARAREEARALDARVEALADALAVPEPEPRAYIVISVTDRTLVLEEDGRTPFHTRVAVGMGRAVLDGEVYSFDTPPGLYRVTAKEEDPVWIAPDWHYLELAQKKRLDTVPLKAFKPLSLADGSRLEVQGDTVARCTEEGCTPYGPAEEIVADGKVVIPPWNTVQRRYPEVLGTRRLKLGGAYAIHGTNKPGSIGRAASHGCIRVRNADIEALYEEVDVGTPVLVY